MPKKKQRTHARKTAQKTQHKQHTDYVFLAAVLIAAIAIFLIIEKSSLSSFFWDAQNSGSNDGSNNQNIQSKVSEGIASGLSNEKNSNSNEPMLLDKNKLQGLSQMQYADVKKSLGISDSEDVVIFIQDESGNVVPISPGSGVKCIGNPSQQIKDSVCS